MSNSTRREAERITVEVAKICGCNWEACTSVRADTAKAIDAALQARDERAAKIAEQEWALMSSFGTTETDHYTRACHEIAAAIRKDD